jgi:hypothetical protein
VLLRRTTRPSNTWIFQPECKLVGGPIRREASRALQGEDGLRLSILVLQDDYPFGLATTEATIEQHSDRSAPSMDAVLECCDQKLPLTTINGGV